MKNNILFGRLGNKTNDIKFFKSLLPLEVKNVVEPFGGTFAISRIVYKDDKYNKIVNDNDETLFKIYKNPYEYSKICKELNKIAGETLNENNNVIYENFIKKIKDCNFESDLIEIWKSSNIIRGRNVKYVKNANYTDFIEITKKINFSCEDYLNVVKKYCKNKDNFIFLDPPYLFSDNSSYSQQKRKEGEDCTNILYELYNVFRDKRNKAKIMLIINDMKIIRWLFDGYIKSNYEKIYQIGKRKSRHLIICNY